MKKIKKTPTKLTKFATAIVLEMFTDICTKYVSNLIKTNVVFSEI